MMHARFSLITADLLQLGGCLKHMEAEVRPVTEMQPGSLGSALYADAELGLAFFKSCWASHEALVAGEQLSSLGQSDVRRQAAGTATEERYQLPVFEQEGKLPPAARLRLTRMDTEPSAVADAVEAYGDTAVHPPRRPRPDHHHLHRRTPQHLRTGTQLPRELERAGDPLPNPRVRDQRGDEVTMEQRRLGSTGPVSELCLDTMMFSRSGHQGQRTRGSGSSTARSTPGITFVDTSKQGDLTWKKSTELLAIGDEGPARRHQTSCRRGEKTELRASGISETSVLVSCTEQELHFPCRHFEVKAPVKNSKTRRVSVEPYLAAELIAAIDNGDLIFTRPDGERQPDWSTTDDDDGRPDSARSAHRPETNGRAPGLSQLP